MSNARYSFNVAISLPPLKRFGIWLTVYLAIGLALYDKADSFYLKRCPNDPRLTQTERWVGAILWPPELLGALIAVVVLRDDLAPCLVPA